MRYESVRRGRLQLGAIAVALAMSVVGCAGAQSEATRIDARSAKLAAGDVVPTQLARGAVTHRTSRSLAAPVISSSKALAKTPLIREAAPIAPRVFRETSLFVAPGSDAQELVLPVDAPDGASVYLLSKSFWRELNDFPCRLGL